MKIAQSLIILINPTMIVLLILILFLGYKNGLLMQLFSVLNLFVKLIVAWMFAPVLARILAFYTPDLGVLNDSALDVLVTENINTIIWFILIYLGLTLVFLFLVPLLKGAGKLPVIKPINQVLGALFGVIKFYVYSVIVVFVLTTALFSNGQQAISESWLVHVQNSSPIVFNALGNWVKTNPAINALVADETLSDEDIAALETWLEEKGINQETINEITESLNTKNE
jgi:uncharacterized membrane protein required for colicin V production